MAGMYLQVVPAWTGVSPKARTLATATKAKLSFRTRAPSDP
jgi:hypothetical protein